MEPAHASPARLVDKPGPWVDLALTLPVFLAYHLGVVFLKVRNASDLVTGPLLRLAEGDRAVYLGITAAIGATFALAFYLLGRGQAFRVEKFLQVAIEGVVYAAAMGIGTAYVVGRIFAGTGLGRDPYTGLVMSLGAGFYEELAFRVLLFGLGARALVAIFARQKVDMMGRSATLTFRSIVIIAAWSVVVACAFSSVHYIGAYGDAFQARSFVARALLGLALSLIYAARGFATAVWAHALYDVWVLVL